MVSVLLFAVLKIVHICHGHLVEVKTILTHMLMALQIQNNLPFMAPNNMTVNCVMG